MGILIEDIVYGLVYNEEDIPQSRLGFKIFCILWCIVRY